MTESGTLHVGFLGSGRMATALAKGWLRAGHVRADSCRASDPLASARQSFAAETGCSAVADNREVAAAGDLLLLAVKPQSMPALLEEIRPHVKNQLVVSIAAGITLRQLTAALGPLPAHPGHAEHSLSDWRQCIRLQSEQQRYP